MWVCLVEQIPYGKDKLSYYILLSKFKMLKQNIRRDTGKIGKTVAYRIYIKEMNNQPASALTELSRDWNGCITM